MIKVITDKTYFYLFFVPFYILSISLSSVFSDNSNASTTLNIAYTCNSWGQIEPCPA